MFDPIQAVFRLSSRVALEVFDAGALALVIPSPHLIDLTLTEYEALQSLDGRRTLAEIVTDAAKKSDYYESKVKEDRVSWYVHWWKQDMIEIVIPQEGRSVSGTVPHYIKNPDVVLREEDEDGGLLFNPDTGQIKVTNPTGLFIWKYCDGSRSLPEVAQALRESFEDVPGDQVEQDVQEFVSELLADGFVGTLELSGREA